MEIGFIGLGNMGFPIARRLVEAGHQVTAFDTNHDAMSRLSELGAQASCSPREVADHAPTVIASLPSPHASLDVAAGPVGVVHGQRITRFIDLSTVGRSTAMRVHTMMARRHIVAVDSPVSGGVAGAEQGTLAVMVSCPRADFDALQTIFTIIGRPFFVGEQPGLAQTMKLANNMLSATAMAATAEVLVMGVKAGLDAHTMIEVLNGGSGATSASRDKFPRAVLPRTFDYGFATGLMVKDIHLYLDEVGALGVAADVASLVSRIWDTTLDAHGAESDFTSVIRPIEAAAGIVIGVPKTAAGHR